jgi:hypothetical protein
MGPFFRGSQPPSRPPFLPQSDAAPRHSLVQLIVAAESSTLALWFLTPYIQEMAGVHPFSFKIESRVIETVRRYDWAIFERERLRFHSQASFATLREAKLDVERTMRRLDQPARRHRRRSADRSLQKIA